MATAAQIKEQRRLDREAAKAAKAGKGTDTQTQIVTPPINVSTEAAGQRAVADTSTGLTTPENEEVLVGGLAARTAVDGFMSNVSTVITTGLEGLEVSFADLTTKFSSIVAADDPKDLQAICGTMTYQELTEGLVILDGIERRQQYDRRAIAVKKDQVQIEAEKMLLHLEQIKQQIRVARAANKIAIASDSLDTEVKERQLRQQANEEALSHRSQTNALTAEDNASYRRAKAAKNTQRNIEREAAVTVLEAIAKVAVAKAAKKTDWANTYSTTPTQTIDVEAK